MSSPGLRRRASRLGLRQAGVHALIVAGAFLLAGLLTTVTMDRVGVAALRERVLGEAQSLREEFDQRGAPHLPHTLLKRERLWRGFAYGLVSPRGVTLVGPLSPSAGLGWSDRRGRPQAPNLAQRPYLVDTLLLPDGSRLAIGQDLSAHARQSAALTWTLFLCGLLGVAVCVAASALLSAPRWRRIVALAAAARQVSGGRLEVRAAERPGPPQDDLDDLVHAFNGMLDRIDALVTQVRQVSAGVAHDLRTPLTRVMQRLERLRARTASQDPLAEEVTRLERDLGEILRTFEALLQLAELESAAAAPPARVIDVSEVVERVGEAFRPDIEEGGRRLTLDCAPTRICGDEQLVAQAVANLLENAIRHTPPGSSIAVQVRPRPEPQLRVVDDGPGVPSARRADVLKPLVRLEASRSTPGSGLGLALVAAVAAKHRARLDLEDAGPGLAVTMAFSA